MVPIMFQLAKDRPKPKPMQFENNVARQRVLLAGMDCLAGQLDLFATDGPRPAPPVLSSAAELAGDDDG